MSVALVRPTREESEVVDERRESERWTSPRIILTLVQLLFAAVSVCISALGFIFLIGSCVFGAYMLSQKNDVTSEMSNAQLAQQISSLSVKVDNMTTILSNSAAENAELKNTVATLRRDLDRETDDRKGRDGWLEARIVSEK